MLSLGCLAILAIVTCFIITVENAGKLYVEYELNELSDGLIVQTQEIIRRNSLNGIDLDRMPGFDEVLLSLIKERKDIAFMVLVGSNRRVLAFSGKSGITVDDFFRESEAAFGKRPVIRFDLHRSFVYSDQGSIGSIVVGIDRDRINRAVWLILVDCIIAATVVTVIVREAISILIPRNALTSLFTISNVGGRNLFGLSSATSSVESSFSRPYLVSWVRLIIFLMAFAEELIRPFLSLYIGDELHSRFVSSPTFIVSSTLSSFMILCAVSQFIGAFFVTRFSTRTVLFSALLLMLIGSGLFASSNDWLVALIGRSFTGAGFGVVLIASQAVILISEDKSDCVYRFKAVGNVAAAMVAAGLCGPLIGGLLADHFGYHIVLITAFFAILLACVLAMKIPNIQCVSRNEQLPIPRLRRIKSLWNPDIVAFLLTFTLPAKIVASAMLVYWVPLTITRGGENLMMVGRIITLYFLGYFVSRRIGNRLLSAGIPASYMVLLTSMLSAITCYLSLNGQIPLLALTMFIFGAGHAISNTAQLDLYSKIANTAGNPEQETKHLSLYRFAERFGGIIGPPLCVFADAAGGLYYAGSILVAIAALSFIAIGLQMRGFQRLGCT